MGTISVRKKGIFLFGLLSFSLVCTCGYSGAYSENLRLLALYPSSGVEGTSVNVSLDVAGYFLREGGSYQSYIGLTYLLVWDPLGPSNTYSVGNLLSPRNLQQIGTATIGTDGVLRGSARIPYEGLTDSVHNIYAVYEKNSASSYKEWWWASFNYEGQGGSTSESHIVSVSVTGQGYVTKDPDLSYYEHGSFVTLTAEASSGWEFSEWGGDASGSFGSTSVFVLDDTYVTATFVKSGGGCIIATATYGGPLSQEVVFMRHVRDDLIGSNNLGQLLVTQWNSFYYSWSPPVAQAIAGSETAKNIFGALLTPLLGLMHLVSFQYNLLAPISLELASVVSFFTAAWLAIMIYIAFPVWIIYSLVMKKSLLKQTLKRFRQFCSRSL